MEITTLSSGSQAGNCHMVFDGKTRVLLDVGISFKKLTESLHKRGLTTNEIAGILITHEHGDHVKGARGAVKGAMDVYTSMGTATHRNVNISGHRVHIVKSMDTFAVGTFDCLAFDVIHNVVEPLCFCLTSQITSERVMYITDTMVVKYRVPNVTHWLIECDYDEESLALSVKNGYTNEKLAGRIRANHMSLATVKQFLADNDLSQTKRIHLIHLSNTRAYADYMKAEVKKAAPGIEVTVAGR